MVISFIAMRSILRAMIVPCVALFSVLFYTQQCVAVYPDTELVEVKGRTLHLSVCRQVLCLALLTCFQMFSDSFFIEKFLKPISTNHFFFFTVVSAAFLFTGEMDFVIVIPSAICFLSPPDDRRAGFTFAKELAYASFKSFFM